MTTATSIQQIERFGQKYLIQVDFSFYTEDARRALLKKYCPDEHDVHLTCLALDELLDRPLSRTDFYRCLRVASVLGRATALLDRNVRVAVQPQLDPLIVEYCFWEACRVLSADCVVDPKLIRNDLPRLEKERGMDISSLLNMDTDFTGTDIEGFGDRMRSSGTGLAALLWAGVTDEALLKRMNVPRLRNECHNAMGDAYSGNGGVCPMETVVETASPAVLYHILCEGYIRCGHAPLTEACIGFLVERGGPVWFQRAMRDAPWLHCVATSTHWIAGDPSMAHRLLCEFGVDVPSWTPMLRHDELQALTQPGAPAHHAILVLLKNVRNKDDYNTTCSLGGCHHTIALLRQITKTYDQQTRIHFLLCVAAHLRNTYSYDSKKKMYMSAQQPMCLKLTRLLSTELRAHGNNWDEYDVCRWMDVALDKSKQPDHEKDVFSLLLSDSEDEGENTESQLASN